MAADTAAPPTLARRRLLQALAALGTGALPGWHAAAAALHERDEGDPLLRPFEAITETTGRLHTPRLRTTGRWPAALRGRFHRNGPALFQRGSERQRHWFDGDGMVQQFAIDGGHIAHRGALVETAKLRAERAAGRFLVGGFGTALAPRMPVSGPDSFNTANTNALEHGGRLLALWEGGSAHALDPATLDTLGPVLWRPDTAQLPFSAHPKVDPQGVLWNIGTSGPHLLSWQIDAQGRLQRLQHGRSPFPGGMVHDMAVTARHLVVPLPPVRLDFMAPLPDGAARHFDLVPGEPLRVGVIPKGDIAAMRVFELPPMMVFHVANAWDDGAQVQLAFVGGTDASFLSDGATAPLRGQRPAAVRSAMQLATLDLARGTARVQDLADQVEFPRLDPRRIGLRARWLLSAAAADPHSPFLHQLLLRDVEGGRVRRFDFGAHCIAEEHIVVPRPGSGGELEAWLLGTHYDSRARCTRLSLFEAAHLEDGPVAQAELPTVLPLGFHGNFAAV